MIAISQKQEDDGAMQKFVKTKVVLARLSGLGEFRRKRTGQGSEVGESRFQAGGDALPPPAPTLLFWDLLQCPLKCSASRSQTLRTRETAPNASLRPDYVKRCDNNLTDLVLMSAHLEPRVAAATGA